MAWVEGDDYLQQLKDKVSRELDLMTDDYEPELLISNYISYKPRRLQWLARWGQGYKHNKFCAPRGMVSARSAEDYFKDEEEDDI